MNTPQILTRRDFFSTATGLAATAALSSLTDVPLFVQKALAEGGLGQPGTNGRVKKLLFIFLRGANDGLNNVIPMATTPTAPKSATTSPSQSIPRKAGMCRAKRCFRKRALTEPPSPTPTRSRWAMDLPDCIPLSNS